MKNATRDKKAQGYIRAAMRTAEHINKWDKENYVSKTRKQQNEHYKKNILFSLKNALTFLENKKVTK